MRYGKLSHFLPFTLWSFKAFQISKLYKHLIRFSQGRGLRYIQLEFHHLRMTWSLNLHSPACIFNHLSFLNPYRLSKHVTKENFNCHEIGHNQKYTMNRNLWQSSLSLIIYWSNLQNIVSKLMVSWSKKLISKGGWSKVTLWILSFFS